MRYSRSYSKLVLPVLLTGFLSAASIRAQSDDGWPPPGWDPDWATYQNDFQRSGRSWSGLGDVNCNLTLLWSHTEPDRRSYYAGPIIKDGRVVQAFDDRYKIFDLAIGAVLYEIPTGGHQISCTPTIATVAIGAEYVDVLFLAAGTNGRVLAYDWNDIGSGPLWSWEAPGVGQTVRFGGFVVLSDGSQEVLFVEVSQSRIYALQAADGLDYAGWGGTPWTAPGFGGSHTHFTSDGSSILFVGENPPGFPGDIYALDAFTKNELWRLSTAGGLQAGNIFGLSITDEGFQGNLLLDFTSVPPSLYANSAVTGEFPVDGVFYRLNLYTGGLISATPGNRTLFATPIAGTNQVYLPTYSRWSNPPAGDDMIAFRKSDGVEQWASQDQGTRFLLDGLLSTEQEGVADKIVAMDERGRLTFYDAGTGDEVLYRRVLKDDYFSDQSNGGSVAMIQDTLVVSSWNGSIFVLANTGIERPRLNLLKHRLVTHVPLSGNPDTTITFQDIYSNSGCADLTIQCVADLNSNGTLDLIAAEDGSDCKSGTTPKNSGVASLVDARIRTDFPDVSRQRTATTAAAGAPPYVVLPNWSDVAAPGETKELSVRINSSLLARGEYTFYVRLATDDPDYFLNHPALAPEIEIELVYGCLDDTTTLAFGVGGANQQLVTNTGRLGTAWWSDGPAGHNGFLFEGDGTEYYQGGLLYGVSQRRLAMNTPDWSAITSTDCYGGVYRSFLAEPNQIDGDCKPALRNTVALPDFSVDGFIYQPLTASAVYSSWVDSVQLFVDQNGEWDWALVADPFNGKYSPDSTIGTLTRSRTIGIFDAPGAQKLGYLNDATLQILEITNRTAQPISGLGIAHFFDPDLGLDTVQINRSISAAWDYSLTADKVFGNVKIPFGPGYDPLCNVWGMDSYDGFWSYSAYWDSAYSYIQTAADSPQGGPTSYRDGQAHVTLAHDVTLAPGDTMRLAVVHFRLDGVTSPGDPNTPQIIALSHTFNKLAGFDRGDVNNDNKINLSDLIILANYLFRGGPGPIPFRHLGDLNADGIVNLTDVQYMVNYYFFFGAPPKGDWEI